MQARRSPFDDVGEELRDEALIVRFDLLNVDGLVALAVEVVRVECTNCGERLRIALVREVSVRALTVPGVERMVADHGETLFRKRRLVLEDMVQVLQG